MPLLGLLRHLCKIREISNIDALAAPIQPSDTPRLLFTTGCVSNAGFV